MTRVNGLRYGAEDYIVKPFKIMVLSRIEVVLERYHKFRSYYQYIRF